MIVLIDILGLTLSPAFALFLRVDPGVFGIYLASLAWFTLLSLLIKLAVFRSLGMYRRYWRFASVDEALIVVGSAVASAVPLEAIVLVDRALQLTPVGLLPFSIPLIDCLLTVAVAGGVRFGARVGIWAGSLKPLRRFTESKRVLLVGAGEAGAMVARELRSAPLAGLRPVAFADDDPKKQGMTIHGLRVEGSTHTIGEVIDANGIEEVIITMPSAPGAAVRRVVDACSRVGVPSRIIPSLFEVLSGRVKVSQIRDVNIQDLLQRGEIAFDPTAARSIIRGRSVLVTGAGGSIGTELCRQVARAQPASLVVLGHGENSIHEVSTELSIAHPRLDLSVVIADVRDNRRMEAVFAERRPEIVFHTAAHKHVPLMESNLPEAVTNNVGGTLRVVRLAESFGAEKFVLISSDKAVNPTSVMGVTKRVAERIVSDAAERTGRLFISVRFGNVLDSRGSVIPLFRKQIAMGGPVSVTHPDVTRYFMTIPEAVYLTLLSLRVGKSGGICVLDMGEPVRMLDLARRMIELSGSNVGQGIEIVFCGLRSGEKLHEELWGPDERPHSTAHPKILLVEPLHQEAGFPAPATCNATDLPTAIEVLLAAAEGGRSDDIQTQLRALVPGYRQQAAGRAAEPPSVADGIMTCSS